MVPLHIWIQAARLRTLPLAFAVIALGTGMAYKINDHVHWGIFALAVFTAGAYQILSNYANDLGDGLRGTDDHRTGEKRAIASGLITADQMKRAVHLWTALALIGGGGLSFLAFQERISLFILFSLLNIAAVLAAKSYTMGPKPYAYWGGGDFIFWIDRSARLRKFIWIASLELPISSFGGGRLQCGSTYFKQPSRC
jgi:1,4-dihydroxy-2-naphthoate octaprenyltransferase